MSERVDIVMGPGVYVGIDPIREVDIKGIKVAFSEAATEDTEVVLYDLFSPGTAMAVPRESVPQDAILLMIDNSQGWEKPVRDWARARGLSVSHKAIVEYDSVATEEAQCYNTMWLPADNGLDILLRMLVEFKRCRIPFKDLLGPGIGYDFQGDSLMVRVNSVAWISLLNRCCRIPEGYGKAGAIIESAVEQFSSAVLSIDAYADILHLARSTAGCRTILTKSCLNDIT